VEQRAEWYTMVNNGENNWNRIIVSLRECVGWGCHLPRPFFRLFRLSPGPAAVLLLRAEYLLKLI